ncbi:MAG TPA: carbohydrate ABC transporter permease [Armatimonadota bacterium]|jgi:ABC-type glycerol-3-phosphate transport system permease component
MPIIDVTGHKSIKIRLLFIGMYLVLALLGVTMAYPFLITVTSSTSNALDYYRFAPLSRSLYSREERFVRLLVPDFPEQMRGGMQQFSLFFKDVPSTWVNWKSVGDDTKGIDTFSRSYLQLAENPQTWGQVQRAAGDYAEFVKSYPISDCLCAYNERDLGTYFREIYTTAASKTLSGWNAGLQVDQKALDLLCKNWGVPVSTFYIIKSEREASMPWDQPNFVPMRDGRAKDFDRLREAYRDGVFLPKNVDRSTVYSSQTRPAPMRQAWSKYLGTRDALALMGLTEGTSVDIATYNKVFRTNYATLRDTPFPIPASAPLLLRQVWEAYVQTQFPRRLLELRCNPAMDKTYQDFVRTRFKGDLARCNSILSTNYPSWDAVRCPARMPEDNAPANLWAEFVGQQPYASKIIHCAEVAYQDTLRAKYGTVEKVNAAYGWQLHELEQAEMPYDLAYLATFVKHGRSIYMASLTENYGFVMDYLVRRGHAVGNTLILIVLTLLAALTVNPLAAYALSRFQLRQMPAIILFLLATMAFPAAVTMIPGFLLMRDIHMLNTYLALILPGVANGMSIFLLKGFFDSLPPELYEAAALDGAPEWMVFMRITLPLSMPILAVIALNSFIGAYNSWEWALVVCQNKNMWTLAVWLYQFNTQWGTQPWAVMASFVVASVPVFLVFLLCQNVILRGIVLPQMK